MFKYVNDENAIERAKGDILLKSQLPIWDSLKYYDSENEKGWVEQWMTERYYFGNGTESLLTDIVNSRLGNDFLRNFKLEFLFAKEALGLTTKELIQVIDLYEKQRRDISLAVEASALGEILKLNEEEEQRLADNYGQWKKKKLTKKGWWEKHQEIENEYRQKRSNVLARYSSAETEGYKSVKSFASVLLEYRQGKTHIENDRNSFNDLNAEIFELIQTPLFSLYSDRDIPSKSQAYFIGLLMDNISDERKSPFGKTVIEGMREYYCPRNTNERGEVLTFENKTPNLCASQYEIEQDYICWLYRDIVMLIEGISEEELERLYNLFYAMKDNFSGVDEGDPYEEWNGGIIDSDEREEREELIKQRDKMRLRKLLQKVIDERD